MSDVCSDLRSKPSLMVVDSLRSGKSRGTVCSGTQGCTRQAALDTQNLSFTYLLQYELASIKVVDYEYALVIPCREAAGPGSWPSAP